ncbi:MAG TPA: hypothetical protein VGM30_10490 [Puia sp.]|jgi:hypothetical protein
MKQINIAVPDGRIGDWEIKTFVVTIEGAAQHNLNQMGGLERYIVPGEYKYLLCHKKEYLRKGYPSGYPVMSNTPAEIIDHMPFIEKAHGRVLIFGLGLGMIVQALIDKREVEHITVVEIASEVIQLSGSYYQNLSSKVQVFQGDAFSCVPTPNFDAVWFDIWDLIDDHNLKQMRLLKKRWKEYVPIRMCWAEKECMELAKYY